MTELQERCIDLALKICKEINGNLGYVPDEDVEQLLSQVTEDNVDEVASELASLAWWFN